MHTRPRIRRVLAAATVASALLLATACGGGSGSVKDAMTSDSPSASSSASPSVSSSVSASASSSTSPKPSASKSSQPRTDTRLESVLITQDDVPDGVTVSPFTPSADEATADDKACQPLLDLLAGGVSAGRAEGHASNRYEIDGDSAINVILVASYAPGDAEKLMKDGVAALPDCAKFTAAAPTGQTVTYETREEPLTSRADDTVGIELTTTVGADTIPTAYGIIRVGDLLAIFINLDEETRETSYPDRDLLDQQTQKMRTALKN